MVASTARRPWIFLLVLVLPFGVSTLLIVVVLATITYVGADIAVAVVAVRMFSADI